MTAIEFFGKVAKELLEEDDPMGCPDPKCGGGLKRIVGSSRPLGNGAYKVIYACNICGKEIVRREEDWRLT